MVNRVVIGGQFGDEGKGKIIHELADVMAQDGKTLVMRFNGGPNAGHTLTSPDGSQVITHMVPSGIIVSNTYNLIGAGTVTDPSSLMAEMAQIRMLGYEVTPSNFGIATESTVILPIHKLDDAHNFTKGQLSKSTHTSTGRGVAPAYADKANHLSLRIGELTNEESIANALRRKVEWEQEFVCSRKSHNAIRIYQDEADTFLNQKLIDGLLELGEQLAPYMVNEGAILHGKTWVHRLFEGGQGNGLSVDHGWHPGTSSSSTAMSIPCNNFLTFGVFKAYASSVGHGDRGFISQMEQHHQDVLREGWREFGATTKKPRSIGYFDLVQATQSVNSGVGIDYVALTCLDRLEDLHSHHIPLKMVMAYEVDGRLFKRWSPELDDRTTRMKAKPIFKEIHMSSPSWVNQFVGTIEETLERNVFFIGNGPKQNDYKMAPGASLLDGSFDKWY